MTVMGFAIVRAGGVQKVLLGLAVASMGWGSAGAAERFLGADAVIVQAKAVAATESAVDEPEAETLDSLAERAKTVFADLPRMEPARAASEWLGILLKLWELEEAQKMNPSFMSASYGGSRQFSDDNVFAHLPGPETWPELHRLVQETTGAPERHLASLQLITARLTGDKAATAAALEKMKQHLESQYGRGMSGAYVQLESNILPDEEPPQSVVARFEQILELRRKNDDSNEARILVPDLLPLSDESTARRLLKSALELPNTQLNFLGNTATAKLAKTVALENLNSMKEPRWDLVMSPGSADLYEAMVQKFGVSTSAPETADEPTPAESLRWLALFGLSSSQVQDLGESDSDDKRLKAQAYYYLDLLRADRTAEAADQFSLEEEFLSSLQYMVPEALAGMSPTVLYDQLTRELDKATTAPVPLWEVTQKLARMSNDLPTHTQKLQTAIDGQTYAAPEAQQLNSLLANALLELNKPQQAAEALIKIMDLPYSREEYRVKLDAGEKLVRLGSVLDRPEWADLGIEKLLAHQEEINNQPSDRGMGYFLRTQFIESIVSALLTTDRAAEAEAYLLEQLKKAVKSDDQAAVAERAALLKALVVVYGKTDRLDDVMTLLTDAPWWNAPDIVNLGQLAMMGRIGSENLSLVPPIARALHQHGHKDEAITYLKRGIVKDASADELYDTLTSITGTAIIPWLDELATRDRFQERPVIWKAVVLHRDGQLDRAEEAARQAMEIDPSDGEQPKGRRLFSYKVLADILIDKGETAEAEKLQKVLAAVRLAEQADEFHELGLAEQAIAAYDQASRDFSDAYCVEWRLARRLQERGDEEGATHHYRKAFELMPEQFGRMSQLCFGCENIFELEKPQSIAEQVLQRLAAEEQPVKPTVFHLLGQLREAQARFNEAADYYRKATQSDPAYFDAWESLYDLAENAFLSADEKTSIAVRLVELDPHLQHFRPDNELDIPAEVLWRAGASNRKWMENIDEPIHPLRASKAFIEQQRNEGKQQGHNVTFSVFVGQNYEWPGPAMHLMRTQWFTFLRQMMH